MSKHIKWLLLILVITGYTLLSNDALAQEAVRDSTYVSGVTAGRARSLIGVGAGLVCLVLAWRAKNRSTKGDDNVRTLAISALVFGLIGLALSVMHLLSTAGAVFGSGSGKAGAIVGVVIDLTGMVLATMALRKGKENGKG